MMTFEIKRDDITRIARKLDKTERDKALKIGLLESGNMLKAWIMKNKLSALPGYSPDQLHVITNRLRSSIGHKTKADGIWKYNESAYELRIGTNVEYAPKHELGIGVRKRPFMSASIENKTNQEDILRRIARALNEALEKD